MHLIITFPKEIATLVAKETEELGGMILDVYESSLLCEVDDATFYKIHLHHSLADQIFLRLRSIPARSPEMVFDHIRKIKWFEYLNPKKSYSLSFYNSYEADSRWEQTLLKKINQEIWDTFKYTQGTVPRFQRDAEQAIVIHDEDGGKRLSITLNTSGYAFGKKNYSGGEISHPEMLQENIANSLLKLMDYKGEHPDEVLWDPFCGSGTIAIEGVFESLKKAHQINSPRGSFGFENFLFFNRGLWREIQEDAKRNRFNQLGAPIFASDIEGKYVELAKESAAKNRIDNFIDWNIQDFFDVKGKGPRSDINQGMLVSCLPIKESMPIEDMAHFYKKLGAHIRGHLDGWRIGLLVGDESPWREINITPDDMHPINNCGVQSQFLIFN